MPTKFSVITNIVLACLFLSLAGCATTGNPDPYEKINRKVFSFNYALDKAIVRPVARAYNKVVPVYMQARITNFFNNLELIPSAANDALQLNVYQTLADSSRFICNSTIGILGLYDPASKMDLPPHHNDLGLTFARWGVKKSPYIVVPFFGPSTVRDTFGDVGNVYLSLWPYINDDLVVYSLFATNKLNQRAALLPADKLVDTAFDPYIFVRNAYLQKRTHQINQFTHVSAQQNNKDTYVAATNQQNADTYVPPDGDDTNSSTIATQTSSLPTPQKNAENNSVSTGNPS